ATHGDVYAHYRTLIGLRRELLRCDDFDRKHLRAFYQDAGVLALYSGANRLMIFNTGAQPAQVPLPTGMWRVLYDNLAIDPKPTVAHTHQVDNLFENNQNKVDQLDERSTLSSERNDPITGRIILAAEDGADRTTRVLELAAHQALLLRSTLFETDRKHNG
ncbi:MAG: DUF3459 domain-containing protein, partial [Leptospiraceae bacterium]|nr:DUF3459 domain-containing protein [Leptospiraceae bacterium]